ncbi:MAG: acyltransferase family protein [Deltaproteobacteria bacterium]|nr:acyltransferase family protein [Deltaproteobacteria bacterium]
MQIKRPKVKKADPEFLEKLLPLFNSVEKYFRYRVFGLEKIPSGRALVVMNHGIIPYHGFLLAKKFFEARGQVPRGLGAEFLFMVPGLREFFHKGGALNASPENGERLLNEDQTVFIAPGGIYEALLAKQGLRRIPWERRKGFVELAIKTKSPIVPTYCAGINRAYLNSYFLLKPRIKLLEKIRFSLPLFLGIGLLPFPVKLLHRVGNPISIHRRKKESEQAQIDRIHGRVMVEMRKLARIEDK